MWFEVKICRSNWSFSISIPYILCCVFDVAVVVDIVVTVCSTLPHLQTQTNHTKRLCWVAKIDCDHFHITIRFFLLVAYFWFVQLCSIPILISCTRGVGKCIENNKQCVNKKNYSNIIIVVILSIRYQPPQKKKRLACWDQAGLKGNE